MSRNPFSRLKDAALEKTILVLLRSKLERYGDLRRLSVDTSGQRLSGEISLHGDPVPIQITEARYRVGPLDGERCQITFYGIKTTKLWLQNLLDDRFPEVTVPVPAYVRTLL